jgi:hypothetical protein
MARKPRGDRRTVADQTVSVRLTGAVVAALDELLAEQNAKLAQQGLPPLVTRGVFLRSLVLGALQQHGKLSASGEEVTTAPPIVLHPPKKRPKNVKPTSWEKVMGNTVVPDETTELPRRTRASKKSRRLTKGIR